MNGARPVAISTRSASIVLRFAARNRFEGHLGCIALTATSVTFTGEFEGKPSFLQQPLELL